MLPWLLIAALAPFALYGLHRYCLSLEELGYLYYKHKKPPAGGGSVFDPLQELLQPQIRHVLEIKDELPVKSEDDRGEPGNHFASRKAASAMQNPDTSA